MRPAQCGFHCAIDQASRQVVHLSQAAEMCDRGINVLFKNKTSSAVCIEIADVVALALYCVDRSWFWSLEGVLEIW
jgi:hypothetical protein